MKLLDKDAILYVDNHLLVCNKPAGLLTQPSGTDHISLEALGKTWIKEQFAKPANVFLHAVHRLDCPISGIVVFARTSKALSRLNQALRCAQFEKTYIALTEGTFCNSQGVIAHHLCRSAHRSYVSSDTQSPSKISFLKYALLKKLNGYSLLKIHLLTGRYHQIRVQLAEIGHPIIGDRKYGSKYLSDTIFLHHHLLCFPHPITQTKLTIEAPISSTWQTYIKHLS